MANASSSEWVGVLARPEDLILCQEASQWSGIWKKALKIESDFEIDLSETGLSTAVKGARQSSVGTDSAAPTDTANSLAGRQNSKRPSLPGPFSIQLT